MDEEPGAGTADFGPDGKMILTGSYDGKARLREVATGKLIGKSMDQVEGINAVALRPDGRHVITASARIAQLYDSATGRPVGPPIEHLGYVTCVAFSPDGRRILTGGRDRIAQLRDSATLRPIGRPMAHGVAVLVVAFSPDGQMILTVDNDRTARFWDADTGLCVGKIPPMGEPILAGAFRPHARGLQIFDGRKAWNWPIPAPIAGDLATIERDVQVMTGREFDPFDGLVDLGGPLWHGRQRVSAAGRSSSR